MLENKQTMDSESAGSLAATQETVNASVSYNGVDLLWYFNAAPPLFEGTSTEIINGLKAGFKVNFNNLTNRQVTLNLPGGVFSVSPTSETIKANSTSKTLTVMSSATPGNYEFEIVDPGPTSTESNFHTRGQIVVVPGPTN
ncbi:hypothetical protein SCOR_20200 [Sulfidibacter corallicola]|uniref:Uncharacterized protein n=1 Tax=Sulfidibacter corallicola TaxID=2818388 RepID=A0A8A4TTE2_SULCO|nr:hypothetical protein [Sulfidibacter corallicola]QTD53236.1 hypothetical protein J3U87_12335 [Sulfidibacter corallicola]